MSRMDKVNAKLNIESECTLNSHLTEFANSNTLREEFVSKFMQGSPILTNKKAKAIMLWFETQMKGSV